MRSRRQESSAAFNPWNFNGRIHALLEPRSDSVWMKRLKHNFSGNNGNINSPLQERQEKSAFSKPCAHLKDFQNSPCNTVGPVKEKRTRTLISKALHVGSDSSYSPFQIHFLLERNGTRQDKLSHPYQILTLWWSDHIDFHRMWFHAKTLITRSPNP